jgi:hypothetical protein
LRTDQPDELPADPRTLQPTMSRSGPSLMNVTAALLKGATLVALGMWVVGVTAFYAWSSTVPKAGVMGVIGILALLTNGAVAVMLFRFRGGDSNMRSVWICSRNDAIGNFAVLLASAGVFGTGTGWPDVIVASIMAALGISGGCQIIRQALSELTQSAAGMLPALSPPRQERTTRSSKGAAMPRQALRIRRDDRSRSPSSGCILETSTCLRQLLPVT